MHVLCTAGKKAKKTYMGTVKITARGQQPRADGLIRLKVYYQEKGVVIRHPVGIMVEGDRWDEEKMGLKGRDDLAKKTNDLLKRYLAKANELVIWFHMNAKPITPEAWAGEWDRDGSREMVVAYIDQQIERDYERGLFKRPTYYMKRRLVKRLRAWNPASTWADVNRDWVERFDAFMAAEFKKKEDDGFRERQKMLKYLKSYLTRAKSDKIEFADPWKGFRMPTVVTRTVYLSDKELVLLEKLYDDRAYLIERMKAWATFKGMKDARAEQYVDTNAEDVHRLLRSFLFQCYSGIRVSDAKRLQLADIEGEYLVFTPYKTRDSSGKQVRLPITSKMKKFISTAPSGRLLPGLGSDQKYNKGLKPVGWMIGTRKELTTHVARHTFATMAVARNVSLVSLRDLLGVTSLETVEIYAHSSLEQQTREMRRAFDE